MRRCLGYLLIIMLTMQSLHAIADAYTLHHDHSFASSESDQPHASHHHHCCQSHATAPLNVAAPHRPARYPWQLQDTASPATHLIPPLLRPPIA